MISRPSFAAILFAVATLVSATVATGASAQDVASSSQTLTYRVTHAIFGKIGTYSNQIDRQGDETVVRNQVHLVVRTLGITLHREEGDRTEHWLGNRLMSFHGTTTANGDVTEISGVAQGDQFAVTSAKGTLMAPGDIRPSNPWSAGFTTSGTMMRSDSGEIQSVKTSPPSDVTVKIGGKAVAARLYEIAADPHYKIWINEDDIPVKFDVDDDSGMVSFELIGQN